MVFYFRCVAVPLFPINPRLQEYDLMAMIPAPHTASHANGQPAWHQYRADEASMLSSAPGDNVPAVLRLIAAHHPRIDEAILTGDRS